MQETKTLSDCCLYPPNTAFPELVGKCMKSVVVSIKDDANLEAMIRKACMTDCVFKEGGAFTSAGVLIKPKLLEMLEVVVKSRPDFKDILTSAFEKCFDEGNFILHVSMSS